MGICERADLEEETLQAEVLGDFAPEFQARVALEEFAEVEAAGAVFGYDHFVVCA